MKLKISWYEGFLMLLKEFLAESAAKAKHKVVDVLECKKTGVTRVVYLLDGRHTETRNVADIVANDSLIESFDPKTVRSLTYIATVERLKPEYSIAVQQMTDKIAEFILEVKSKNGALVFRKSAQDISRDESLIARFNAVEAHRIGYMAGVWNTVRDYQLLALQK